MDSFCGSSVVIFAPGKLPMELPGKSSTLSFTFRIRAGINVRTGCTRVGNGLYSVGAVLHHNSDVRVNASSDMYPRRS